MTKHDLVCYQAEMVIARYGQKWAIRDKESKRVLKAFPNKGSATRYLLDVFYRRHGLKFTPPV